MSENNKVQQGGNSIQNNLKKIKEITNSEKIAEILLASIGHYYKMAMDHHTKAATTSNLLLIIVGALIALVGHDNELKGPVDIMGGVGIFVIGIFGAVWVLKQHERYYYWQKIAGKYEEQLDVIVPMFEKRDVYHGYAHKKSEDEFGILKFICGRKVDRRLWIFMHVIVALVGIFIALYTARNYLVKLFQYFF